MNYDFSITVPANTAKINPKTEIWKITYGVITRVIITIPPGHQGLGHLQLLYHEFQIYPLNPGGDYHGGGLPLAFDERQPIFVTPYALKARAWNEDETYEHEFIVNLTVLYPEDIGWRWERVTAETKAQEMLGHEIEV